MPVLKRKIRKPEFFNESESSLEACFSSILPPEKLFIPICSRPVKNVPGVKVSSDLLEALAKAKEISDKSKKKEKYNDINLNYFEGFIKELKKTTSAAGCHIMSVGYEEIIPPLIGSINK